MANLRKTPKSVNMRQRTLLCAFHRRRLIVGSLWKCSRGSEDGNFNINGMASNISLAAKRRMFIKERKISVVSNTSYKSMKKKMES